MEATYPERETTHAERVAALAAATSEAEAQLAEMEAQTRCALAQPVAHCNSLPQFFSSARAHKLPQTYLTLGRRAHCQ